MTNALAPLGMRWQKAAEPAAAWHPADSAFGAYLPTGADVAAVRPRGYSFAIRPRGTPPV